MTQIQNSTGIQRITFAAETGVQSRLGGNTHRRRASQYLLRSLSGGEGNQGPNYKKILRLPYDVIITYDNRKSNLR